MFQSEFLSRREREHRAKERRASLDRFMNNLAKVMFGFCLGVIIGQAASRYDHPFDYDTCDYLVAPGNLASAPIPSDRTWNEIRLTPGGNWCVATDLND